MMKFRTVGSALGELRGCIRDRRRSGKKILTRFSSMLETSIKFQSVFYTSSFSFVNFHFSTFIFPLSLFHFNFPLSLSHYHLSTFTFHFYQVPNCLFYTFRFQGTAWYTKLKYGPMVEFGNLLNYTAMGVGNHDFDDSVDGFVPFAEQVKKIKV